MGGSGVDRTFRDSSDPGRYSTGTDFKMVSGTDGEGLLRGASALLATVVQTRCMSISAVRMDGCNQDL
ncbi:hypothetical protein DLM46_08695 [Paraburkholderia lacunae]|uniref:Uncharacterized protein n=1 Tax=Paraburkholderia lacunae TaxID=2211104 RepID=A0A370NBL2_9BURK|nr:hypothetical protein DLM46_08695 [Paraburkholderia lacunae]